jgi:DNA polymerase III delta subunit
MSTNPEPLLAVYAIQGEDRPKVDRALARLVRRIIDEGGGDPERLSASETPMSDVIATCQTLSFGGLQGVIVTDADAWRAAEADLLVAYLEDPNPASVLALVSVGVLPQRLQQVVQRVGRVLHWGPDPKASARERRKWLELHFTQEVARLGGHVPPSVARAVIERSCGEASDAQRTGMNALMLSNEAEKLVAYAGGAAIDREMVAAITPEHPEARVYELADALVAGRAPEVFERLSDLGSGDDRTEPVVIVAGLVRHYRALARAQDLGPGASVDEVSAATGMKGFPARKVTEQAQALPGGAAARAVVRLARLEMDLRVSAQRELGSSPDDGRRFVLETAARDLVAIAHGSSGV